MKAVGRFWRLVMELTGVGQQIEQYALDKHVSKPLHLVSHFKA
jgi:hypothetical protein